MSHNLTFPAPYHASIRTGRGWSQRAWTVADVLDVAKYHGFFAMTKNQFGELKLNPGYAPADPAAEFLMEQLGKLWRRTVEGKGN